MKKNHFFYLIVSICLVLELVAFPLLSGCKKEAVVHEKITYRLGIPYGPTSRNPYVKSTAPSERMPMYLVYEPLLIADTWVNTWPWLAEKWDFNASTKTVTYNIDKRAKWSDGKPVTATDVKFTFESMWALNVSFYLKARDVTESIEIVDSQTIKFHLLNTYWNSVYLIGKCWIIPEHIWSPIADKMTYVNENPVGSGPYLWTEFEPGSHSLLTKNPNYWKQDVNIDEVVLQIYSAEDAMQLALKNGDIDAVDKVVTFTAVPGLLRTPDVDVTINDRNSAEALIMNLRIEPFNIKEFRKAFNVLLDRNSMVNVGVFGYGSISAQLTGHATKTSYYSKTLEWPYATKTQKERAALANTMLDAIPGMSPIGTDGLRTYKGNKLVFELLHISDVMRSQIATIIQENAKQIGVQFNLKGKASTLIQTTIFVDVATNPLNWTAAVFPNSLTGSWDDFSLGFVSKGTGSAVSAGWSNPIQDKIEQTRSEVDEAKRLILIREIQAVLLDEMVHISLFHPVFIAANRTDRFTGWIPDLSDVCIVQPNGSIIQILALKPK